MLNILCHIFFNRSLGGFEHIALRIDEFIESEWRIYIYVSVNRFLITICKYNEACQGIYNASCFVVVKYTTIRANSVKIKLKFTKGWKLIVCHILIDKYIGITSFVNVSSVQIPELISIIFIYSLVLYFKTGSLCATTVYSSVLPIAGYRLDKFPVVR